MGSGVPAPSATELLPARRPAAVPEHAPHGLPALLGAYTLWGVLPVYFRALHSVPPPLIIAYRLVLCCVLVLAWLAARGEIHAVRAAIARPEIRKRLAASAVLISINWLTYVWAVSVGRVVEASFGYFMNPLLNVLLGVVVLRERLRRMQWLAVALAALGVLYMTLRAGTPPFVALALALSFGTYGLIRKTVAVEALVGLAVETTLIVPLGAAYLLSCELAGAGAFAHADAQTLGLLMLSGLLTALPLALFSFGARRSTFATVGLVSYLSPTLQLLVGVYLFHEPFDPPKLVGFAFIWSGLLLYSADALLALRKLPPQGTGQPKSTQLPAQPSDAGTDRAQPRTDG